MTGFFRNGCCDTGPSDAGSHTVCVSMTDEFLQFSKQRGNDLSAPLPDVGFPVSKAGDRWCLCAPRWQEALEAGQAPRVILRATHEGALEYCSLDDLKRFAIDLAWWMCSKIYREISLLAYCWLGQLSNIEAL